MSLHIFAAYVTHHGTAANNRGENEGNSTTLQKLLWRGQVHTTVSAEAIRFALRRLLAEHEPTNRRFDEGTREHTWEDPKFARWKDGRDACFIDDDLLGFMAAEAAGEERGAKGGAQVRRSVLELTRAVSLTPWAGDVSFNVASPGATASAAKKGAGNPVPYAAELHATRYQYGAAMTPARLRRPERAAVALRALAGLCEVAGNHGRFLYDFSPESVVYRLTQDPAPRLLYCFEEQAGKLRAPALLERVAAGDIPPGELVLGGGLVRGLSEPERALLAGAELHAGVRAATEAACRRLEA